MGAYVRLYAFLSQIFDYGNTAIEKRFLFLKRLIPLLEFGRERDTVDLSKVVLTHHTLKDKGKQPMTLNADGTYKLPPIDATGTGSVQEKQQAYLREIIEKVNGLFEGELTQDDQLVYVNGVLRGKLLENETLVKHAASNSKEQFANSPDLNDASGRPSPRLSTPVALSGSTARSPRVLRTHLHAYACRIYAAAFCASTGL